MKKLLFILLFISSFSFLKAQQQIDPRIQEVYGQKTNELVANNPTMLNFLNELLNNRVKIEQVSSSEDSYKFPKLSAASLLNKYNPALQRDAVFNPETFNPLKYNLEFTSKDEKKVYAVDNTNYVIIISPQTINH